MAMIELNLTPLTAPQVPSDTTNTYTMEEFKILLKQHLINSELRQKNQERIFRRSRETPWTPAVQV